MYQFTDDVESNRFFWFRKKLIENNNWALLTPSAKAIFPVIALHAGQDGRSFPSEQRIAIQSGITDKVVRQGIRALGSFPDIECETYRTKGGMQSKRFHVTLPNQNNSDCFQFYQQIIDTGIWRELKPVAKALYPVMKYFSNFDFDRYIDIEDLEYDYNDFEEVFPTRKYDFCCGVTQSYLIDHAGISRRSINSALDDLMEIKLIEELQDGWKVFRKPQMVWKPKYLNNEIRKAYNHLLQEEAF